eukprot:scaffold5463_cov155-Skeletonema_marinoi.AAC.3
MQLSRIINQVRQGGVCIRHGAKAKVKRCSSERCRNNAQIGGECKRHGARVNICSSEGCILFVHTGGVCRRHLGRGYCKVGVNPEPMPEPLFL